MPDEPAPAEQDPRWESVLNRDAGADGSFVYAVRTTGVYCRPSSQALGMTPTAFRSGGRNAVIRFAVGQCSLGAILVAQSDRGVCTVSLDHDPDKLVRDLQDHFPNSDLVGGDADFEALVARVVGFVETPQTGLDLPLDIRGTAFQAGAGRTDGFLRRPLNSHLRLRGKNRHSRIALPFLASLPHSNQADKPWKWKTRRSS